jgi:predicted  nucleic acid-binding Zn-ribbon protein
VAGGEIKGLRASNQALKDQLDLATKQQSGVITPQIEQLHADVEKLSGELTELKDAHTPQLEKLSATTASIEQRLATVSQSNTTLGQVLQLEARLTTISGMSALARLKKLQDEH